jgi:hypothetical protein
MHPFTGTWVANGLAAVNANARNVYLSSAQFLQRSLPRQ